MAMTNRKTAKFNATGKSKGKRVAGDAYFTSDDVAISTSQALKKLIGEVDFVIEPSAGGGAYVVAASTVWPLASITAVEPNPPDELFDLTDTMRLEVKRWEDAFETRAIVEQMIATGSFGKRYLVLGNPPYNYSEVHIDIAMRMYGHHSAKFATHRWVAFLLPINFLCSTNRYRDVMHMGGLRYIINLVDRPKFNGKGTGMSEFAMFVWQAGYIGPYSGYWLDGDKLWP